MDSKLIEKMLKAKRNKDIVAMEKLYKENSHESLLKFEYARLLRLKGNLDESRKLLLQLLNARIGTHARLELGMIEKECGNIDEACKYFESLLNEQNKDFAMLQLGKIEKENGNIKKAREYFEFLIEKYENKYARLELGKLEREFGNTNEARKHFTKLLKTTSSSYAILELGILEYEQGNVDQARNYFKSLLNEQNRIFALNLLAMLEFLEKNYNTSINYINIILEEIGTYNDKTIIFLLKELNIFFNIDYNKFKYTYSMKQLLNYDEAFAVEHTISRHKNDKSNGAPFNNNIDIKELYRNIKKDLTKENKIYKLTFNDWYLIKMNNVGLNGENYLFVTTIPHSKNIITMFPVKDKKSIIKYLDEDEKEHENKLIKKDK